MEGEKEKDGNLIASRQLKKSWNSFEGLLFGGGVDGWIETHH